MGIEYSIHASVLVQDRISQNRLSQKTASAFNFFRVAIRLASVSKSVVQSHAIYSSLRIGQQAVGLNTTCLMHDVAHFSSSTLG